MRNSRRASLVVGTLLAAALGASHAAGADTLTATRFDVIEKAHDVELRVAAGVATMVVRRRVQNTGSKSDQAVWSLALPGESVAVSLRTAGKKANGGLEWFTGELMEAEAAARRYQELTGIGGFYPKDPALLSWRHRGLLALQVFPVPAKDDKIVEYTLALPTHYSGGAYRVELPEAPADADAAATTLPPTYTIARQAGAGGELFVNGAPAPDGVRLVQPPTLVVELRPKAAAPLSGAVGSAVARPGRVVSHVSLNVAPQLSRVPSRARVAVVLDTSRSMAGTEGLVFAAARSYVSQFTDATIDVITFNRRVTHLTKAGVSSVEALSLLTSVPQLENGSQVDAALRAADQLLAGQVGERRILLLTDLHTRASLTPARVAALQSGAILHVATVEAGDPALERDDEDAWAPVAKRTGGVLWRAHHPERVTNATRSVFEEWARPKRIDAVRVRGAKSGDTPWPTTLAEGDGFDAWSLAGFSATAVTVQGLLWSTPFSSRIEATPQDNRRTAQLVFGQPLMDELSEPEMMALATQGGVVSPVTSYLAIEPGVRPSTEGLEWGGGGGTGQGFGRGGGVANAHVRRSAFDKAAFFATALGPAAKRCGAKGPVVLVLETTLAEVVDVGAVEHQTRDKLIEDCVREASWNLALPPGFSEPFETFSQNIKPG